MKKLIFAIMALILLLNPLMVSASSVPYESFIKSSEGNIRPSSPLYIPAGAIPMYFEAPTDLFIDDDVLYVADENLVYRFEPDGDGFIYSNEKMETANGIFVRDQELYVADPDAELVLVFDYEGNLINEIGKPTAPYFGEDTKFVPTNVVVSPTNKLYITSEGLTDGIISINEYGTFLGFYGANESKSSIYSFDMMSSGELGNFFRPTPPSVSDIAVDSQGYIYTSTYGLEDSIRKLNVSSTDTFSDGFEAFTNSVVDIWVDAYGNIYTLTNEAEYSSIWVNDPNGEVLFAFSETVSNPQQLGLLSNPTAITVDSNLNVYVADQNTHQVIVYTPSEIASDIFMGSYYYNNGDLEAANDIWREFIKNYPDFPLAYDSLGQEAYKAEDYQTALDYFALGSSSEYYSDAKSNIRREFLNQNFLLIVGTCIVLGIMRIIYKKQLKGKIRVSKHLLPLVELVKFSKHIVRHPEDGYYQLKYKGRASYTNAIIIYITYFIMFILSKTLAGILFGGVDLNDIMLGSTIITMILVLIIILVAQTLISSIMFGEADIKLLFKSFAYVLLPFIILSPIMIILSNVLTLNEAFIMVFLNGVVILWTLIMIFKLVSELNNYSMSATFKNILLTIFSMLIIICVFITFIFLTFEMVTTILDVIKEVLVR